jgi:PAS domain S-box-containing protein
MMRDDRILIVDDEPPVTALLGRRLEQEGFTCQLAFNAGEALQYIQKNSFAAALVDIRMPGKDGISLLGEMKSLDPDLAAIMVTAIKDRESAVQAMKLGADDYIVKPFDLDEVTDSLYRALDSRRLVLENRAYHEELERLVAERTRDLERRNNELAALNALAAIVSRSLDLDDVLEQGLDQLLQTIQVDTGGVYLWEGDEFRLQAHQGATVLPSTIQASRPQPPAAPKCSDEALDQATRLTGAVSEACVPLRKGSEPLGMLLVASDARLLTREDLGLLTMIGDQVSVALDNARLYGEVRRQAAELRRANTEFVRANRRLRTLREIGASIVSTFSLDEVLQRIADGVVTGLEYRMALIGVVDQAAGHGERTRSLRHVVVSGASQDLSRWAEKLAGLPLGLPSPKGAEGRNLIHQVVEDGRIQVSSDLSEILRPAASQEECQSLQQQIDARSLVVIPLQTRERMLGTIVIAAGYEAVDLEELAQLQTFADQAAIAIENARLYQETLTAQQRSTTILLEAFAGVIVVDANLRIREFNPAAEGITGYRADEVLGHPLWQLFGEELYGDESLLHRAISGRQQIPPTETTIAGRRGRRDILLGITPLPGEKLTLTEYLLSFADITELKEIDRLKTNIVANVSHELRTPLASIRAYAELLMDNLDEGDDELRQRFLGVIDQETQHLSDLITDLLNVARLESDRYVPHKEKVSLRDLAAETLARFRIQAEQKGIALVLDAPSSLPHMAADREMMGVLFKNLIQNAIKFSTDEGEVRVSLRVEGDQQVLTVADEGIGVSPEDLPHIFEKFYRAHSSVESGFEGAGLGLSLVSEVVETHKGQIEVQSREGKGTTFSIVLPMDPSPAEGETS